MLALCSAYPYKMVTSESYHVIPLRNAWSKIVKNESTAYVQCSWCTFYVFVRSFPRSRVMAMVQAINILGLSRSAAMSTTSTLTLYHIILLLVVSVCLLFFHGLSCLNIANWSSFLSYCSFYGGLTELA